MRLQTLNRAHRRLHYKVWLESKGRRVIEPEPGIPSKILKSLKSAIHEERERIEAEWASFMIRNDWLKVRLVGSSIVLSAYPKSHNRFERTVAVQYMIPNESFAKKVTAKDV